MTRICSFVLGAVAALTFSACGSDESTGTGGKGASGGSVTGSGGASGNTGGSATGTGGSAAGTGGTAKGTGGSATGTGGTGKGTGGSATGTGGSATATGGTGGASNCQTACQKLKAANCGDLAAVDCAKACGSFGICASEADAYYACVGSTGVVSCEATDSLVAGCDASGNAFDLCSVCLPPANSTACGTCTQSSCCTQLRAYAVSSDGEPFDACISATTCTTQVCVDACVAMYPIAGKAYNDAVSCQTKSCVTDCVCAAGTNDTACGTCVKSSCCNDYGTYVNAADIVAFDTCAGACAETDAACFDACAAASPLAAAAYEALYSNCLSTTCAAECAAP